jgi:hypothetical protein
LPLHLSTFSLWLPVRGQSSTFLLLLFIVYWVIINVWINLLFCGCTPHRCLVYAHKHPRACFVQRSTQKGISPSSNKGSMHGLH